jgi:hypothetical protein
MLARQPKSGMSNERRAPASISRLNSEEAKVSIQIPPKKAVMSVPEFLAWSGIGNTFFYTELKAGNLKAIKIGRRTFVRVDDAQHWLDTRSAY